MPDDVRIGGVEAAQLSDIAAGNYVGTTAVKQADGSLKALEVHIFPESSRGTGEGHRPWDLQPGSTMTNANVEKVEQVAVEKIQGQLLTLKYKDGEQKIFIPPGTPIVKNVPWRPLAAEAGYRSLHSRRAGRGRNPHGYSRHRRRRRHHATDVGPLLVPWRTLRDLAQGTLCVLRARDLFADPNQ